MVVGVMPLLWAPISNGQTTSITSSGLNTHVSHAAGQPNYDITGGTRPGNGTNLFHSFGDFSVGANHIANFRNDSGLATSNILSRVTGGNPSTIFGTIQTTGFGQANVFLMNPAGIVFGPHASLNVGGSVTFTTADYLKLADGVRFKALPTASTDALLSTAPAAAFGFLGSNPGAITVQGSQLSVPDGKSLTLVGGDIRMTNGTLKAPSGQVFLASFAGRGEAIQNPASGQPGLTVSPHARMGSITLDSKLLNVPPLIDTSGSPGGAVVIRGGQLVLNRATVNAGTTPEGDQRGAGISIAVTDSVTMNHSILSTQVASGGDIQSCAGAGSISIVTPSVVLRSSAIDASTSNKGPAGDIVINGSTLQLSSSLFSTDSLRGKAGDIVIQAGRSFVSRASTISAVGSGGGMIDVDAKRVALRDSVIGSGGRLGVDATTNVDAKDMILEHSQILSGKGSFSNGGTTNVNAERVMLVHSHISSGAGFGADGGTTNVNAERVTLRSSVISSGGGGTGGTINVDAEQVMLEHSHISSGAENGGDIINVDAERVTLRDSSISEYSTGRGGMINVNANNVTLTNSNLTISVINQPSRLDFGGHIAVNAEHMTLRNSSIHNYAEFGGNTINVNAERITLMDSQIISRSLIDGGAIDVGAQHVTLRDSMIRSEWGDTGGTINVDAELLTLRDSQISSTGFKGGTINVDAKKVMLRDSQLTTAVSGGPQTVGGTITVNARNVALRNGQILSTATEGQGGTIAIRTDALHQDARSVIDASSQFGTNGTVTIEPLP